MAATDLSEQALRMQLAHPAYRDKHMSPQQVAQLREAFQFKPVQVAQPGFSPTLKQVRAVGFGPDESARWEQMARLMVGPAAVPDGTPIYLGLNGRWVKDPLTGRIVTRDDFRQGFWKWTRNGIQAPQLRTKGYLDSTAAIVHTTTDQEIIDTTRKECPIMELVPQETSRGKVASYDILTARAAAIFTTETVSTITPGDDTYKNATKTIGILISPGGWTDVAIATMGSQYPSRDARALEVRNKTWSLNEAWENEILNGSSSLGASSNGFVGIRAEIYTTQTVAGLPSGEADQNYDKNNSDIDDTDIDKAIADGASRNVKYNLCITDLWTWQKIKQFMMGVLMYVNPETEIAWGLKALAWHTPYGTMPIVASKFMPVTAAAREVLFLDTKFLAQRMLLDSTMEMLPKAALSQPFVIKKFANIIDKTQAYAQTYNNNSWPVTTTGTSKMARIYGIA
jgi:hypothetical protein